MEIGIYTGEVFDITNRGVVLIIEMYRETELSAGDKIQVGPRKTRVKDIDWLAPGHPTHGLRFGVFVEGPKSDYLALDNEKVYLGHRA